MFVCVCGEDRQDRTGKGQESYRPKGREKERESEGANRREFERKINTEIKKTQRKNEYLTSNQNPKTN